MLTGIAVLGTAASFASATILFDSHGFEPNADPTINYVTNTGLFGQPPAALPQNRWDGSVFPAGAPVNNNYPLAGVFSYNLPTAGNLQYALLQSPNIAPGSFGYYFPKANQSVTDGGFGNYTPVSGQKIAITFSMNVYGGYAAAAANSVFYGVTAFNQAGTEIASVGLNNFNGQLELSNGATITNGGFTGSFDTFYGYELLLDYDTQTWAVYTQPLSGPGAFVYTLRATGAFANASTSFSDADLAAFTLGTANGSGYAAFDDYTVQTVVPEPASLTAGALAFGLLAARRRRSV